MSRQVRVSVADTEAELAADALWQAGAVAIEERPGLLVAGVLDGGDLDPLLASVAGRWPAEVVAVDLDGALDAWRPHARAVPVGEHLVVHPPWVDLPPGTRRAVVIDPGRAFGHGAHPSTRLVLDALDGLVQGGERVLDVGCGSGVLAIAALALGSASAVGVDTDPAAVAATRANAGRNGVDDRLTVVDDVAALALRSGGDRRGVGGAGAFDLVVANMLLPLLVTVAPVLAAGLAPGGAAVVSGVLVGQGSELLAALAGVGLAESARQVDDGWLALTLRER